MKIIKGNIYEQGNGFPDSGDYVTDIIGGDAYKVISTASNIQNENAKGNYINAEVEYADWYDIEDDKQPMWHFVPDLD